MTNLDSDAAKIFENLSKKCLTEKTWKKNEINEYVSEKLTSFKKNIYEIVQNNVTRLFSSYLLTKQDYKSWQYFFIGRIFEFSENTMELIRSDNEKIIVPPQIHNIFNSENKLLNFLFSPKLLENLKIISDAGVLIYAFLIINQERDNFSEFLLSADLGVKVIKQISNKIWKNKDWCKVISSLCNFISEMLCFSLITKLDLDNTAFKDSVIDYTISSFTRVTQIILLTKHFTNILTQLPDYLYDYVENNYTKRIINENNASLNEVIARSEENQSKEEQEEFYKDMYNQKEDLIEVIINSEENQSKEEQEEITR